jgi:hypothetical protein
VIGEGREEFFSTVCTCGTEDVYIHGGEDGLVSGIFTWEVFTSEVFTVRSSVVHLFAGSVSADGDPGH